jgi:hypothetical protein
MASEIKANKISPATGTAFTLGDSGDTFTLPSGATLSGAGAITIPSGGSLTIDSGATITNNGTNGGGFGKVLQVVSSTKTTTQTISTATFTAITNLDVSITPSSTSSKILIIAAVSAYRFGAIRLYRNGSSLGVTSPINEDNDSSLLYLDSPATTSSTTYQVYGRHYNSSYPFIINNNTSSYGEIASTITAIEVAG